MAKFDLVSHPHNCPISLAITFLEWTATKTSQIPSFTLLWGVLWC